MRVDGSANPTMPKNPAQCFFSSVLADGPLHVATVERAAIPTARGHVPDAGRLRRACDEVRVSAALDAARKRLGRFEVGRALVDGGSVGEKDQLEAALRAAGLEVAEPLDRVEAGDVCVGEAELGPAGGHARCWGPCRGPCRGCAGAVSGASRGRVSGTCRGLPPGSCCGGERPAAHT